LIVPARTRRETLRLPVDLRATLGIQRHGTGDPTIRIAATSAIVALRTPDGAATLTLSVGGGALVAEAWGSGAEWALDHAPALVGAGDDPSAFDPPAGLVRELHRRAPGLRLSASCRVMAAVVPAVLEQKVIGKEARRAWRGLIQRHGDDAPGPHGMRLAPGAEELAALPYHAFHTLGVERTRADTIRRVATMAARLERTAGDDPAAALRLLRSVRGIGDWTVAEVAMAAFGDADAVSVGDYHLKNQVAWALAGEPRGSDDRMLELLEPYRGHRGRVCRLLSAVGTPPRYGPRLPLRRLQRH
jgi:3-methyladenine DNA glycosylase/8-oxoguanine DNA glycosylase